MKAERIEVFKAQRQEIAELAPLDGERSLPELTGGERLYFPICLDAPRALPLTRRVTASEGPGRPARDLAK